MRKMNLEGEAIELSGSWGKDDNPKAPVHLQEGGEGL